MNTIKAIRERLKLSQEAMGESIGCSQGNVSLYERGQTVPPDTGKKLIELARSHGLELSLDQIYGLAPLPDAEPEAKAA